MCRLVNERDREIEKQSWTLEALEAGKSYYGRLLNYKKDGMPFWNLLTISPIKDEDGKVIEFIGKT